MFRGQNIFKHYCTLQIKDNITKSRPFAEWHERIRETFNNWRIVHRTYLADCFFRSNHAYVKEIKRHIHDPRCNFTIHPLSKLADIERVYMFFVWSVMLSMGPLIGAFFYDDFLMRNRYGYRVQMVFICQIFMAFDIVFRFFFGYVVKKTQLIVLDQRSIVKHYLKTFFFLDVGPPLSGLILYLTPDASEFFRVTIFQINLFVTFRISSFTELMDYMLRKIRFGENCRVAFRLLLMGLFCIHLCTCFLGLITLFRQHMGYLRQGESWLHHYWAEHRMHQHQMDFFEHMRPYIACSTLISCHFFGAGVGRYPTSDSFEMSSFALILMSGLIFYIYATAKIIEFFGTVNISETKFEQLVYDAQQHMARFRYPTQLRRRIYQYYNYTFNRKFFDELKILNSLSEHLRMEVVLYGCRTFVENLNVFRNVSKSTTGGLLTLLKPAIYLPKDVIMTLGEDEQKLFFIVHGTCAVKLLTDEELHHAEDGDCFGDMGYYLFDEFRPLFAYKVVALEPCQIYILGKEEAKLCMLNSELHNRMYHLEAKKEQLYSSLYAKLLNRSKDNLEADIVVQLRKGTIVSHGRRRSLL